uniref:RNA-directed DNA polymerase, eukaryota n=1 Tax=Tanacetum cinerariifolium TaxID=118510 RepID=A0A699H890_TANCI|nr:RNA-directed DNA polymerase, eukaryota [Tanacetum cinerariifolium]
MPLCLKFPRLFALELDKDALVAVKMVGSLDHSFRRTVRRGMEQQQMSDLILILESVSLSTSQDRWICDLSGDGEFRVKEVRIFLDDLFLSSFFEPTRWVKCVPIKIKIFAWRARRDCLPTRSNLARRCVSLESSRCPLCDACKEDIHHVLFRCSLAQLILRRIFRWWELEWQPWISFSEWQLRPNCTGKVGISPIMKCTFGIRKMAYGCVPDALDEYMQMGTTTPRDSLVAFCTAVMELYENVYSQKLTYTHIEKLYAHHEQKHEFPGMIRSIDYTDSLWENSHIASKAQFCKRDHGPDLFILLEALASQDLLI